MPTTSSTNDNTREIRNRKQVKLNINKYFITTQRSNKYCNREQTI